jgi:hypothetical protein
VTTGPRRPDASVWMRRGAPGGGFLSSAVVLAVVFVTTLGGFVVAAALSTPAGAAVGIPGVISLRPLSGWEPAPASPIDGRPSVRITRGSGTLVVVGWGPFAASSEALASVVRDEVLSESLERLSVSEQLTEVAFEQPLDGRRFTFVGVDRESGSAVEGEVTTVVTADGQGVVFVGVAPEGLLGFLDGDLRTMVTGATLGDGS